MYTSYPTYHHLTRNSDIVDNHNGKVSEREVERQKLLDTLRLDDERLA